MHNDLQHLQSLQQLNGSFLDDLGRENVFYTSLIMLCLKDCHWNEADAIKGKAFQYILSRKESGQWVWRYSSEYPPDLDDTAVCVRALHSYKPEMITETVLAAFVQLLIKQEQKPGGPYQTWILPERSAKWDDIDIVVNSNVAAVLRDLGIKNSVLDTFLNDKVAARNLKSRYYTDEFVVQYFLSPFYPDSENEMMLHISRPNVSLFVERITTEKVVYSSSKAFACACRIKLQCMNARSLHAESTVPSITESERCFIEEVHHRCMVCIPDPAMQHQLQESLRALQTKDPRSEIALLPYRFARELCDGTLPQEIAYSLAVANTFGWIGYTGYDKLLDDEITTATLPFANTCVLQAHELLYSCAPSHYWSVVTRILSEINVANAWEHAHCTVSDTLPDYGTYKVLAQKSLGHALGPIIICQLLGEPEQAEIVEDFFTHYIIARQLNDDAHDWHEDFLSGKVNSVSALFIDPGKDMASLQKAFWEEHIDTVSKLIAHHVSLARAVLQNVTVLRSVTFLEDLLVPLERAANQAVLDRDKTKRFLEAMA